MSHDPRNLWELDRRPIIAARLSSYPYGGPPNEGTLLVSDGWEFERLERNGEMAAIPYIRARKADGTAIEAPLRQWDWVQFEEARR